MDKIICKNNVTLCYQSIENIEFTAIEIWLNFGSNNDKMDQHGSAHLIEHVILSGDTGDSDLYAFYNHYGYTSKERIRIYTKTNVNSLKSVLTTFITAIIDFNLPDIFFKYHQQKIIQEIKNHKSSYASLALYDVEKISLVGTGYDRHPAGSIDDIMNLTFAKLKVHLQEMLFKYGIIISITGALPNLDEIVEIIETKIPILSDFNPYSTANYMNKLFTNRSNIFIHNSFKNGRAVIFNLCDTNLNAIDNIICSNLLEIYLKYNLKHLPIEIKSFRYNPYQVLVLFFLETANVLDIETAIAKLLTEDLTTYMYDSLLSYVYNTYLYINKSETELALYNAEQCFRKTEISLNKFLFHLKNYSKDIFVKYISEMQHLERKINIILEQ